MGTITYTDLAEIDFGKLSAAVSDWKTVRDALATLSEDARSGMLAKSNAARWEGVNATMTRDFVRRTADEIADLHTEANSIWNVLDDAHTELTALQRGVKNVAAEAARSNFRIRDNGDGTVEVEYDYPPGPRGAFSPQDRMALAKQGRGYADEINPKIRRAQGLDSDVQRALSKAHGSSVYDAGHADYDSLNDAQAQEAVQLARKGDDMTDKELAELNRLLKENNRERNGEFATKFYKGLGGPEKALEFYAQMSVQGTDDEASKTRLNAVQDLQRNLGHALANATEPDAPKGLEGRKFHLPASWGAEFRKLGTQTIEWQPGMMNKPYGYQILGGMLRYGNYDPEFINPIAEHVTQLHCEDPTRFLGNRPVGSDDLYGFNPSGKLGSGNDPLTGVLEALGHSPEASQEFFTEPPTKYNEDGTVDKNGDLAFASYLDEFTKEDFHWNIDRNDANLVGAEDVKEALNDGPNALGHALEAATTGRPYRSDATADAIKHTPEQARLVQDIVAKFGENPELIRHNENPDFVRHDENGDEIEQKSGPLYALRDSLGDITAEYMGDFQQSVTGNENAREPMPSFGVDAEFDSVFVKNFLAEVGQDPDAYASITASQQAYTANMVDTTINGGSESTVDLGERVRNATRPGGIIAGIMSEARADAIHDYHAASDKQFNDAAADKKKWVNRILSMGIDNTAGRVPVLGDAIKWASEDIQNSVMQSIRQDSLSEAEGESNQMYTRGREAVMDSARAAVGAAASRSDLNYHTIQDLKETAASGADAGHAAGAKWEAAGDAS